MNKSLLRAEKISITIGANLTHIMNFKRKLHRDLNLFQKLIEFKDKCLKMQPYSSELSFHFRLKHSDILVKKTNIFAVNYGET